MKSKSSPIIQFAKDIARPFKRRINTFIHRGDVVTCNCCGHSFKTFRPLGYGEGPVGACWFCDSHPRMRMLKDYLTENMGQIFEGKKILHIAPEKPIYNWLKSMPNADYTAGDKRTAGYRYPKEVIDLDITKPPYKDNTFDVVMCNHVLEHIKNDGQAMREIYRILRPKGIAILLIPIDKDLEHTIEEPEGQTLSDEERAKAFGQFNHVRQYGLDYYDRLRSAGFEVEIIPPVQDKIARYGLFNDDDMIICRKPH